MHVRKVLSISLVGLVFAIAGCSSGSSSSGLDRDPIEDIDGDGIADIVDPDMDGDGIPNAEDPDDDNDGVEDSVDPTPPPTPSTKTCVAASILPPNEEITPGDNGELGWTFLPEGCVLPATRASSGAGVTVRAVPQRTGTATSATVNAGNCLANGRHGKVQCFTEIKVPDGCGKFGVVYDISEVGIVLGDTNLSKGAYRQTVWHTGKSCSGEGLPNPCTQAINLKINEKKLTGDSTKITWDYAPSGCQLSAEQEAAVAVVTASNQWAKPETKTSNPKWLLKDKNAWIIIPNNCQWYENDPEGIKKISYDFSGIGYELGDVDGVDAGDYALDVTHKHGANGKGCNYTDPEPDAPVVTLEFIVGPADDDLTVNADGSVTGSGKAAVYAMATAKAVSALSEPTWSSTPAGYMNIHINGGGVKNNERITIEPGRTNGKYYVGNEGPEAENFDTWSDLQAAYGTYTVRTNYGPEIDGVASPGDPIKFGGNFILRLNAATFTLNKYSVN